MTVVVDDFDGADVQERLQLPMKNCADANDVHDPAGNEE